MNPNTRLPLIELLLWTLEYNCPSFASLPFPKLQGYYESLGLLLAPRRPPCPQRSGHSLSVFPARAGLLGYFGLSSLHAIPADTARTMDRQQRLSRLFLTTFAPQAWARLSGLCVFDAPWMGVTFVVACRFRRCPACGFSLAASFRTSLSFVHRLIRLAGPSPAWTPASPAHTKVPQFRW